MARGVRVARGEPARVEAAGLQAARVDAPGAHVPLPALCVPKLWLQLEEAALGLEAWPGQTRNPETQTDKETVMSSKKETEAQRAEALEYLREALPVGTTVYTVLHSVSSNGMSRKISALIPGKHETRGTLYIRSLDYLIARAGIFRLSRDERGLTLGGAGMDMGFHLVYSLSRELYPDGFPCTGEPGCPSNDHTNYRPWLDQGTFNHETRAWEGRIDNPVPNYVKGTIHSDGGYALNHTWV